MAKYKLPEFGEFDLEDLEDYYDTQIDFQEHTVVLDLNFEEYSISQKKMDAVKSILDNLFHHHTKAMEVIRQDYLAGGTVQNYLTQYSAAAENYELALSQIYLKRIGFYPENQSDFAVFDYTTGESETPYLIVVNFKENGEVDNIAIES